MLKLQSRAIQSNRISDSQGAPTRGNSWNILNTYKLIHKLRQLGDSRVSLDISMTSAEPPISMMMMMMMMMTNVDDVTDFYILYYLNSISDTCCYVIVETKSTVLAAVFRNQ